MNSMIEFFVKNYAGNRQLIQLVVRIARHDVPHYQIAERLFDLLAEAGPFPTGIRKAFETLTGFGMHKFGFTPRPWEPEQPVMSPLYWRLQESAGLLAVSKQIAVEEEAQAAAEEQFQRFGKKLPLFRRKLKLVSL
ncbi:MAG TPA: hypothetical protein PLB51_01680 [Candidatus Paceibacterota bacterium]|nr:hypothetical protein [Candidatus Paceibacterota bacterium]